MPASAIAAAAIVLAAAAGPAWADALLYRCGPNICKAAPNGTGEHRLTTDGRPGGPLYSWMSATADGSRLAVVNSTYAYVLDGRGRRLTGRLTRSGAEVVAEIAPDGSQIATIDLVPEVRVSPFEEPPGFLGIPGNMPYVFTEKPDGTHRDTTARAVVDIAWFGSRLVRDDPFGEAPYAMGACLLAINTDYRCARDVARDTAHDLYNPTFSPDGRFVAIVESLTTTIDPGPIVIYDTATAAPVRQLVGGANTQPTWSPDGKRIAFERGGDIYVAQATGAPREHRVLKGGAQPTWTTAAACRRGRPHVRVKAGKALVTACAPHPGRLTVTLLRAGHQVAERTVTAATGGTITVRLHRPSGGGRLSAKARLR